MRRARRHPIDIRFELAPMLDVVFVLLTFFIFAMVLSKRFTVTDIRLPESSRTGDAAPQAAKQIIVSLRPDGTVLLGDKATTLDLLPDALAQQQRDEPGAAVFLAPDASSSSGELFKLMDTLARAGIRDLRFLRAPTQPGVPATPPGR